MTELDAIDAAKRHLGSDILRKCSFSKAFFVPPETFRSQGVPSEGEWVVQFERLDYVEKSDVVTTLEKKLRVVIVDAKGRCHEFEPM